MADSVTQMQEYLHVNGTLRVNSADREYKVTLSLNRKCQDYVYIKWEYWSIM